jgi:hypothetical protein
MRPAPVKYLTNKELLAEIDRCKQTYCSFLEPEDAVFDGIVTDLDQVTDEWLIATCVRRSKEITKATKVETLVVPDGLVIRLMTYDHIPLDPDRKKKSRAANQTHALVSFPPFKHFRLSIVDGEKVFTEVGRSHWEGGLDNGWFNADKGRTTERMGMMYYLLVERYGRRGNYRGYSYLEEMKGLALVQLSQVGLQFDESKSNNPFAFYTTTINNCFVRVLNLEKKNQSMRDDLLVMAGAAPSMTRQVEDMLPKNDAVVMKPRRGRPPKPKV